MSKTYLFILAYSFCFLVSFELLGQKTLEIPGLNESVEIFVDPWGISHIYAQNERDLFFAQGFNAARDRLFQFEIWRRQATGTVAEILGPREVKRDIGARLFMFRGDIEKEMAHYHPRGKQIIESFVAGVNAYIDLTRKDPSLLSMEFGLIGIEPQHWTPEIVISRHQGLLGNITQELRTGRLVALIGAEKVRDLLWFHPKQPILEIDPKIERNLLFEDILGLYNAFRRPVRFQPADLIASAREEESVFRYLAGVDESARNQELQEDSYNMGSNNWVVSGEHTQSGFPIMANDPHRSLAVPSLRYMTHLVAPGWNVIGGGEPEIPGISIGHNEFGAWGLTVFRTDGEDLYVYETNPEDQNQYKFAGSWEEMICIKDTIQVKGKNAVPVTFKYTRHGPVVFENPDESVAYAIRCAWLEQGGAPYLASLRMDQARTFEEFREACKYSNIPGENMIWADKEGNIGWQAVGIAPVRRNYSGLVPVPGDGSYNWDFYLPIEEKPHLVNPASGIFISANADVTPKEYKYWDAIGYSWSDPYREDRLHELLNTGRKHSVADMAKYQTDYLSIPARTLIPMLNKISFPNQKTEFMKSRISNWDYQVEQESVEASIYIAWEKAMRTAYIQRFVPKEAQEYISIQMKHIIDKLLFPGPDFGKDPLVARDEFMAACFETALEDLKKELGTDINQWQYGQIANKHVLIKHPLSNAVNDSIRKILEVGPAPRGGYGLTVNSTSNAQNQRSGASFRMIVDTGDWDHCLGSNTPGQSGDPHSPFYSNLFDLWVQDRYFPVYYSRDQIEASAKIRIILK
jgi:penicillin amidase